MTFEGIHGRPILEISEVEVSEMISKFEIQDE